MNDLHVSITSCLDATKQAFHDGSAILDKIKKKRALKRAPPPPRLLEESIDQAPDEIEKEKQRGLARFGKAFQEGDYIAIIQLQQVTIQLQASLLEKLRNAAFDDDHAITDFTYLVDAADGGRDKTIAVLHEFKQRLLDGTSRKDFHSPTPNSSQSSLTVQSPVHTPPVEPPPPKARPERTLSKPPQHKPTPAPAESVKRHPTWSRDFSGSGSDDGDAVSGADETVEQQRRKKRNSLLHFLKHTRTSSSTDKHSLHSPIAEEAPRSNGKTSGTTTLPIHSTSDDQASINTAASASNNRDRAATTASNATSNTKEPRFTYEEWEDNPSEIWGARTNPLERRETLAIAPNAQREDEYSSLNRQISHTSSVQPPSPVLPNRTNSMAPSFASFGGGMAAGFGAPTYATNSQPSAAITQPTPDNDYLGFCKAAWKLQNGDKKSSFAAHKNVDPWSRHPGAYAAAASYLACSHGKCAFRSNFCHHDVEVIWNKCFVVEAKGIKFRWKFLAKSHVMQKVVVKGNHSFKCLFCAFQGAQGGGGVYHGIDYYLEHVSETHRGTRMNEVVLYKTGCIMDRVAENTEDFDINLFPATAGAASSDAARKGSEWLNDELLMGDPYREGRDDSMFSANEPWNEGLSDFHYRGEFDRTELE